MTRRSTAARDDVLTALQSPKTIAQLRVVLPDVPLLRLQQIIYNACRRGLAVNKRVRNSPKLGGLYVAVGVRKQPPPPAIVQRPYESKPGSVAHIAIARIAENGGSMPVADLAESLGIKQRAIYGYLKTALESGHVAIEPCDGVNRSAFALVGHVISAQVGTSVRRPRVPNSVWQYAQGVTA